MKRPEFLIITGSLKRRRHPGFWERLAAWVPKPRKR